MCCRYCQADLFATHEQNSVSPPKLDGQLDMDDRLCVPAASIAAIAVAATACV